MAGMTTSVKRVRRVPVRPVEGPLQPAHAGTIKTTIDLGGGMTELVPGLSIYNRVHTKFRDFYGYDGTATAQLQDGKMTVVELAVQQRDGGRGVTNEGLRKIPVQQIARRSLFTDRHIGKPASLKTAYGLLESVDRDRMREAGPAVETVQWAAFIYRVALAVGDGPTKVVGEVFKVSPRTAGLWIAKARRLGFLGEAEGPGKASV